MLITFMLNFNLNPHRSRQADLKRQPDKRLHQMEIMPNYFNKFTEYEIDIFLKTFWKNKLWFILSKLITFWWFGENVLKNCVHFCSSKRFNYVHHVRQNFYVDSHQRKKINIIINLKLPEHSMNDPRCKHHQHEMRKHVGKFSSFA